MKKISILLLLLTLSLSMLHCQQANRIKDKEFRTFVEKFIVEEPVINSKRLSERLLRINAIKPYEGPHITKKEAIKYLKKTSEDMDYMYGDYNVDTEEVTYEKMENIPVAYFLYYTNNYIVLVAAEGKEDSDTSLCILYTLTYEGEMLDQCIIGRQFTREDDYFDAVITDKTHFKIFWYSTNWDNYVVNKSGGIISMKDENGPQSKVEIEDYEISETGKIQKLKRSKPILLKEQVNRYSFAPFAEDDPMSQY